MTSIQSGTCIKIIKYCISWMSGNPFSFTKTLSQLKFTLVKDCSYEVLSIPENIFDRNGGNILTSCVKNQNIFSQSTGAYEANMAPYHDLHLVRTHCDVSDFLHFSDLNTSSKCTYHSIPFPQVCSNPKNHIHQKIVHKSGRRKPT